jgi:hypothetical protein
MEKHREATEADLETVKTALIRVRREAVEAHQAVFSAEKTLDLKLENLKALEIAARVLGIDLEA